MGKFIIAKQKNGEFHFNLKAGNGLVILTSEGYSSKNACLKGIESVRRNSMDKSNFEELTSQNGKFYFNLRTTNGQIIGSSQMYETENSVKNGIISVEMNAPDADIEELY
ncbi:MAG: YegP family protein [Dysgonamonadaceae bacterium]|jgi:uncharacterized protein YegP (UPF0339 family)|nr:YegP family protein [Dysgonamonadaceae bacterium]